MKGIDKGTANLYYFAGRNFTLTTLPQIACVMNNKYGTYMNLRILNITALFAALTIIGAMIKIPLPLPPPIPPLSMQTLFVILSGIILGPKNGAMSQFLYLFIGIIGFPVFAEGGGPAYVLKPTFGYLLGFPLAAFIAGTITYGKNAPAGLLEMRTHLGTLKPIRIAGAAAAGILAVFVLGIPYFFIIVHYFLELDRAFSALLVGGFLVFIPGDIIKITIILALVKIIALEPRTSVHENP